MLKGLRFAHVLGRFEFSMNSASDPEDFRDGERRAAHWVGWVLALVAVPVAYVLTLPPIVMTLENAYGWGRTSAPPRWLVAYAAPGVWLYKDTPLQPILTSYAQWWRETIPLKP